MLIKEIPLLQNICFLYSSSKCFEFTWTEGSNRNETSNTCNTGDEIPCYDPQLSTPEPPTSEEIYKPEFQQGKICDKGSGSLCIKYTKTSTADPSLITHVSRFCGKVIDITDNIPVESQCQTQKDAFAGEDVTVCVCSGNFCNQALQIQLTMYPLLITLILTALLS
eukprot:00694.XXX_819_1927_1 [CDS] Oithona nana genome sequencing.